MWFIVWSIVQLQRYRTEFQEINNVLNTCCCKYMNFLSERLPQRLGLETSSPWQASSCPSFPMFSTSSLASTGCLLTNMSMENFTNIFIQYYLRNGLNRLPTHQNDLRDIFKQAHFRSAGENWEGGSGGRGIRALTRCSNLNSFHI